MSELMDRFVTAKNAAIDKVTKEHPYIGMIADALVPDGYYGFRILDEDGFVMEQYTLNIVGRRIDGYIPGIDHASLLVGVKKSYLEETLDMAENDFPFDPLPFSVRLWKSNLAHLLHKDITLDYKKDEGEFDSVI